MERLIDAGALKTDLTRFYDNEVTAKRLIDEQPTIPAIPVSWLQEKIRSEYEPDSKAALRVLRMWEKEQEAR